MTEDNYDNFIKTNFSYAIVTRASIEEIQALKKFMADHNITICYQTTSTDKLYIKKQGGDNDY